MLFEGAVLQEAHPGGLRPTTFPGPRVGAANRDLVYSALRHQQTRLLQPYLSVAEIEWGSASHRDFQMVRRDTHPELQSERAKHPREAPDTLSMQFGVLWYR